MIEVALEERPQWIRLAMKDKKVLVGMTGESGVKVWDVKNLVQRNVSVTDGGVAFTSHESPLTVYLHFAETTSSHLSVSNSLTQPAP